jgi:hypothetical protein
MLEIDDGDDDAARPWTYSAGETMARRSLKWMPMATTGWWRCPALSRNMKKSAKSSVGVAPPFDLRILSQSGGVAG